MTTQANRQELSQRPQSFGAALTGAMRSNVRQYTMIAALLAIWIIFTILTGGLFISARNLSNLLLQMCTIGILTGGMLLVMVAGHITCPGLRMRQFGGVVAYLMTKAGGWRLF